MENAYVALFSWTKSREYFFLLFTAVQNKRHAKEEHPILANEIKKICSVCAD